MGQVRVDDIRRLLLEPAVKSNPPARIGQPLPHLKRKKSGSGGCQFDSRAPSRAGEGHDAHSPFALGQASGEQNHLALSASDAVECGYDQNNVVQG